MRFSRFSFEILVDTAFILRSYVLIIQEQRIFLLVEYINLYTNYNIFSMRLIAIVFIYSSLENIKTNAKT